MTDEQPKPPEGFRLYGPDLSYELAAMVLRGEHDACNQRIEQLLTWWGAENNGIIRNLIFDLAYQLANAIAQQHDSTEHAAEWAEYTALDKGTEHDALTNMDDDLEWPFDDDGNPIHR